MKVTVKLNLPQKKKLTVEELTTIFDYALPTLKRTIKHPIEVQVTHKMGKLMVDSVITVPYDVCTILAQQLEGVSDEDMRKLLGFDESVSPHLLLLLHTMADYLARI